jgi:hypothetical protein
MPIVAFTSIPPTLDRRLPDGTSCGPAYQRACLESWQKAVSKVVSVNFPEEIAALADAFPDVQFETATDDTGPILGRKLPSLADLFAQARRAEASHILLINSDILMLRPEHFANLARLAPDAACFGWRLNVDDYRTRRGKPYKLGLDYFLMPVTALPRAAPPSMALGVPWWDLWLPLRLQLDGWRTLFVDVPLVAHQVHEVKWNQFWYVMNYAATLTDMAGAAAPTTPASDIQAFAEKAPEAFRRRLALGDAFSRFLASYVQDNSQRVVLEK